MSAIKDDYFLCLVSAKSFRFICSQGGGGDRTQMLEVQLYNQAQQRKDFMSMDDDSDEDHEMYTLVLVCIACMFCVLHVCCNDNCV